MKKGSILIIDDNESILRSLSLLLKSEFACIDTLTNPELIPQQFQKKSYDLILLDMNFKTGINTGNEGIFWLRKILKIDPESQVILITAYGDVELAVKAIKEGATDFIQKPWDAEKLLVTLHNAYQFKQSKREIKKLKNKQQLLQADLNKKRSPIIGNSSAMNEVFNTINKVAKTTANILILGENGTGKELIAREIHLQSKRASEAFIAVDMGSINESLFESELFGHTKGAFTDAKEDRIGRIEAAQGGTLFLDEIGNIPLSLQAKLLRVLQERTITRLGSNEEIPVDIRLISATNKSIELLINTNTFREDLFFRINTIEMEIPALRNRTDDIIQLCEYYLHQYSNKYEKTGLRLTQDALNKLMAYHWPGNIRELKHTIEKAVILSEHKYLTANDFFFKSYFEPSGPEKKPKKIYEIEKESINEALKLHSGNLSKVAKELEMSRTTLYKKIKKYEL